MAAAGGRDQRLPRLRRLQTPAEFQRVREQGQRAVRGCLILNWLAVPGRAVSRVGVVTSRKVGAAVMRNRARRWMRECFRRHQGSFRMAVDLVMVARPSLSRATLREVEHDFLSALRRAGLLGSPEP